MFNTHSKIIIIFGLVLNFSHHVFCFSINRPTFPYSTQGEFIYPDGPRIYDDAFQVTPDSEGGNMSHMSGRMVYYKRFRLWKDDKVASFNSTFVMTVTPALTVAGSNATVGEGIAFILAKHPELPPNSDGQWLGIVNSSTNGTSQTPVVAVEFDTKKSFPDDIDSNHVGLNINSVISEEQVSLNSSDIVIASGPDKITAMVLFNGSTNLIEVYVYKGVEVGSNLTRPIISRVVDVRRYLPSDVYVGFSASTGLGTEVNCVRSWFFEGHDLDDPGTNFRIWIVIVVIVVVLMIAIGGGYFYRTRKQKRVEQLGNESAIQGIETGLGPRKIKLKDLKAATGNFNSRNELGKGGFGIVYKGFLDGIEVAVKRVMNSPQGKQNLIAEVAIIGSVHHKNLVRLIGWCHEKNELILVYDYMPNRSLDHYIHIKDENKAMLLSWETRHKIICGVAQALDYLHNECSRRVLHRDIKASNIMLDSEFNACLGDFGLARMFRLSEKTHHSTKEIVGTPGYMAPEIFHTCRATSESDVFAFGVLALVIACGKRAVFEIKDDEYRNSIVDWVWELYSLETVIDAIDPKLKGKFDREQAECMLVLGLSCCHPNPYMRPSMRTALQVLMGEVHPPLVPCDKPAFIWPATSTSFSPEDSMSGGVLTSFSTLSAR